MKYSVALALAAAAAVSAQNTTTNGTAGASNYTTGLLAALNGAGLTSLAGVLQGMPQLGDALQAGNYTVFAPSNDAINTLLGSGQNYSDTIIMNILLYHISTVPVRQADLGIGANHTLVPTLLSAPLLGPNQTYPLVASFGVDGQPRIRTAAQNVTVGANTTYENLLVHVVDQVISPPPSLSTALGRVGLTGLAGAVQLINSTLPVAALEAAPRLTIFAPSNEAFANISSTLATLQPAQIATVLGNHIINGTVVYSTGISENATAISAAGETFSFRITNGTVYVMSGNATMARVMRTDVPIENGVLHVIDQVLANTASNPEVAASAASVAATARPTSGIGAAGASDSSIGAASKTFVGFSTLAAALVAVGVAVIA